MIEQKQYEKQSVQQPTAEDVRAELQSLLESSAFRRSERHSQFLRYVCETTLRGEASRLNEYTIAHEVFGRGEHYSPGEDSVVRRQAHSLRQKLAEHYARAGTQSRVRIELPVGRYVPVFQTRSPETQLLKVEEISPRPVAAPSENGLILKLMLGVVLAGLLAGAFYLGRISAHSTYPNAISANLREIWAPWLSRADGAIICFSSPLTAVVKQFPFLLPPDPNGDPPRVFATPEQAQQFRDYFGLQSGGHFVLYPAKSQSKTGETLGGVGLASMLTRAGVSVRATQSRFLSGENFRDQNLILLGHDEANRWLDPLLNQLPMRMAVTNEEKARRIVDTAPGPGQPSEYFLEKPQRDRMVSRDYALVTMIRGIDGRHQLLLINGLNTEGTQIAMEYLSDPNRAGSLVKALHKAAPSHTGEWHFQLVLRTDVFDQVPTAPDLLVVKVL